MRVSEVPEPPFAADTVEISARSATTPQRRLHVRGDSGLGGSGQIQRSRLQFPAPGCWRLMLRWTDHVARPDVRVRLRRN